MASAQKGDIIVRTGGRHGTERKRQCIYTELQA